MKIKDLVSVKNLFFFCLAAWNSLIALPSGGEVIQGHATLISSSKALQINANGKAILNWEQFNIASHEVVRFIQSQDKQAILNRVTSGSASEILGSLQANCPIYLVNPNGVFIGSSACIDTAGFLASTADLSNEAFLQGTELLFQEFGNGCIINLGKINASCGDVFLVARAGIDNQGSIEAPNGIAILTTREMMLHPDTKKCIFIRVSDAAEEGIQNSGTIQALAVEFQTQSPYEKAIQHSGLIEAFTTSEQNGRIYLVAEKSGGTLVNGSLTAKSGNIRVLGQTVVLEDGAVIDVSGEFSGGTVLIGGDYQGKNEEVKNAKHTWVGRETVVKADALEEGNGGKIIFWSDEATLHYGKISVRGGEKGGDGGFVEVSGSILEYGGFTDARAPFGKIGELLLDPNDVVIGAATTTLGASFSACGPPSNFNFVNATATNQILNTDLQTQLATCSVTIATTSGSAAGGAGPNNGSITVSSPVTWATNNTLTLTAASFISVSAAVTNTNASTGFPAMNFTANGIGATTHPGITLVAGGVLTANGGNITLNGTSAAVGSSSHGVFFNGGSISTGSGDISVTGVVPMGATGGSLYGLNMNSVNGMSSSSGDISVSGTTNTTGTICYGVRVTQSWNANTTGTLTFHDCVGGTGVNTIGIRFDQPLSTKGDIVAIDNIKTGLGSTGVGSPGFILNNTSVSSMGGNIQITASSTLLSVGTASSYGIQIVGNISTTGNGNITLIGTGSSLTAGINSFGVLIAGISAITTENGAIHITGDVPGGTLTGFGISLISSNSVRSTSGPINISGTSNATGTGSHGVSVTGSWITGPPTGTSGVVTFANCQGGTGQASHGVHLGAAFTSGGDVVFTNCVGGNNGTTGGRGINVAAAFTTAGTVTATTSIIGQGNGGIGFASSANFSTSGASHPIAITASSIGTTGACHGISLTGGILSTAASDITLDGTGGASSTASHGINLSGGQVTTTGTATITCTGTGGSSTGGGYGVFLTGSNSLIQTVDGLVSATGNGGGTGDNAGGIGVVSSARFNATGTGGITLNGTASLTGGNNSHGIVVDGSGSAVTTASGNIIVNAAGSNNAASTDCNGLQVSTGGKINSTTSGSITGICLGGTGITSVSGCNGIFVTSSGSLITTATGSGINLTGTGRGTTTSNRGIFLTTIGSITTTSNAPITLIGTGSSSGTSSNEGIFLTGASTRISTVTGAIQLTGTVGGGTANAITIDNGAAVLTTTSGNITANATGGLSLLAGALGSAQMAATNGNINATASNLLVLTGSTVLGSFAQMTVGSAANTITIQSLGIDMDAGTGSGAFAEISSNGGLITINGAGPISLNGNNNTNTYAQIITKTTALTTATPAISIGQTTPPTSITLQGGSGGTLARAVIATDTGGNIICSTSGSYTITGGSSANDSRAGFYTGLGGSGSGSITLSGTGYLLTGGASGAGSNFAQISTPSTGLGGFINLTSTSGVITLQGGGGTNAPAQILTNGTGNITISAQGAISLLGSNGVGATDALAAITTFNGDIDISTTGLLTLTGGSQSTGTFTQIAVGNSANTVAIESAGIAMTGGGTTATGAFAEIAALGGLISIDGIGPISLTGGSNATSPARVINRTNIPSGDAIQIGVTTPPTTLTLQGGLATGGAPAFIASNVGGDIVCNTSGNWTITGGSSTADARAGIVTGLASGSGDIITTSAGAISITGGSGANPGLNYAGLFTGLNGGSGNISIDATSMSLTGGSSTGANYAQIATPSGGGSITISTSGGPNVLQGGTGDVADAQIITNGIGNIDFTGVDDFSALGGNGASSVAEVNAQGTLTINIGAGNYIFTGNAGDSSFALFTATGAVDLTGGDYTLTGGTSGIADGSNAIIESTGINGSVTLTGADIVI